MGQGASSAGSGRGGGGRRSLRFPRRCKLNASSLSHTFSVPASEELPELLNINTASEEQLMTLPGITRPIARAIVEHRQLIGRFKKVDDLALVSGIGADKLEAMRGEICTNKKILSRASSCTQSLDSCRLNVESPKPLSVNSASVFQLQCIPGLNQELAANIVDHRDKKGPFKSLDDLIKVRGMDVVRLSSIKSHLNLDISKNDELAYLLNSLQNGSCNDTKVVNNNSLNNTSLPRTPGHRKSSSMPIKYAMTLSNGFATAPVNDIFDLLSAYSHRPIIEEDYNYERDGVKCFRLASWNLHQFNLDKAYNPGVREVVCRTILENKISLLAVQDAEEVALRALCEELNCPTLRRVREWKGNGRRWRYTVGHLHTCARLGFIYNANYRGITIEHLSLDELSLEVDNGDHRKTLIDALTSLQSGSDQYSATSQLFRVCGRQMAIVNVLACGELSLQDCERLDAVCSAARTACLPIIVPSDLHTVDNLHKLQPKLISQISEGIHTTLELSGTGRGDILSAGGQFNGVWGVVRVGLSHLAIPRGWAWGGPASPHCPVWAEYGLPD